MTSSTYSSPFVPPLLSINSDTSTSDSNHINTIPSSTSYLVTEAHVNGIPGQVLLNTGFGPSIISSQHWSVIGDKIIQSIPYSGPD